MTDIVLDCTAPQVAPLISTIRAAVNGVGKYADFVAAYPVDRDNVKDYARALAVVAYPKDKPVQKVDGKRTRFGNAVQAAGNGLRAALAKDETDASETDYLAAVIKAAVKAVEHDIDPAVIAAAVAAELAVS